MQGNTSRFNPISRFSLNSSKKEVTDAAGIVLDDRDADVVL